MDVTDPNFWSMGLKLLEGNNVPSPSRQGRGGDSLVSRLLNPTPRTTAGIALAESELVSAMIDISDGVLADFGHIAELSVVGGIILLEDLPLSPQFRNAATSFPSFPYDLVLAGGEDYELCFTAHPDSREKIVAIMKKCGIEAAPVGIVTSSPGVIVRDAAGQPFQLSHQGFNHFVS